MESPCQDHCLTHLLVFDNTINKELVRSLHVYRLKEGKVEEVEREFTLSLDGQYVEVAANPLLLLRLRLLLLHVYQGQVFGTWRCIFAFHPHAPSSSCAPPPLLSFSGNLKLKSIPSLANDLKLVSKLSYRADDKVSPLFSSKQINEGAGDDDHHSKKTLPVLDQDLNCLPYSVDPSELPKNEQIKQNAPGAVAMKKKRAATEDIARIALEDLVKYFGLPIVEASRNLNVGVTVLKRKCREFGIPRWPHRKIKSLDGLIRSLQEEAERQKQESEDAALAVAKRQRMLEQEKETIERKPFMEIQSETRRFRQDVFKRRHRARALGIQGI